MQSGMAHAQSGFYWIAFSILSFPCVTAVAGQLPDAFLSLSSEEFQKRESAQADLLVWARKQPESAMKELFKQSRVAADPEVRERCTEILRALVGDEYSREGEGYIGIALGDEILTVPGETAPRNAIRVTEVRADTPGHRAGIQLNDLILALEGQGWHGAEATAVFRQQIKRMKPETDANLTILRDGKLIELKVRLSRRPIAADMLFNGLDMNFDATEKAAKEAHFHRWLLRMKSNG
jgi:C-terminal processing protease CtpA/Prc